VTAIARESPHQQVKIHTSSQRAAPALAAGLTNRSGSLSSHLLLGISQSASFDTLDFDPK
jgi:hypothetical protein